jgi:hypothetical protein
MNFAGYRPPFVLLAISSAHGVPFGNQTWLGKWWKGDFNGKIEGFVSMWFIYLSVYIYIIHIYLYPFAYICVYLSSLFASYIFGFPGLAGHSTIAGLAIGAPRAPSVPRINYLCKQAVCGRSADPARSDRPWWLGPGGPQSFFCGFVGVITLMWVNYNGLTVLPKPAIMVSKGNYPREALFQVN